MREAEPAQPAPVDEVPVLDPIPMDEAGSELAVTMVDGPVDVATRGEMIDALRAEGVKVLVTLPGGVWLTEPLDPWAPPVYEAAGHTLEMLAEVEQVQAAAEVASAEAAAAQAEAPEGEGAEGEGAEGEGAHGESPPSVEFIEHRAASLITLGQALGDTGLPVEPMPEPVEPDAPHALLPADLVGYLPGANPTDVNILPHELGGPAPAAKNSTPARDVGKFLRGDVAVRVFFVESTGVGNEDWTTAEYNNERAQYINWLGRLARVAPPTVGLVFHYDDLPPTDPVNEIAEEPTDGVNEWVWINEVFDNLGVAAGAGPWFARHFVRMIGYEAVVRTEQGADHAAIAFAVKDDEAPLSEFNGLPWKDAWPHAFFGSYMVTNSRFGGTTFIHELMHVFHAADEYAGGNFITPCRAWSGLGHDRAKEAGATKSNGNHINCNHHADDQSCLMNGGPDFADSPFWRPLMCWHTRAQIGWHDSGALAVRAQYPAAMGFFISPTPRVHIDGDHTFGREDFTYAEDGSIQYGSRRCATGSASGADIFSAQAGMTTNCAGDANFWTNVNGHPGDIVWPSGPTYLSGQSYDEGRVNLRVVDYSHFTCGDGVCDATETPATCPSDCTCGNGICDGLETFITCPADCTFCGNQICEPGETVANCPFDCCVPVPGGPGCEL